MIYIHFHIPTGTVVDIYDSRRHSQYEIDKHKEEIFKLYPASKGYCSKVEKNKAE